MSDRPFTSGGYPPTVGAMQPSLPVCGRVASPGDQRRLLPYRGGGEVHIEFGAYTALAVAPSVSATGLTLHFEHEQTFDRGSAP
jgi:hypothetical protein